MHEVDKKLWEIVINNFDRGGVVEEFSYYGHDFIYDDKKTKELRKKFSYDTVDWEKSTPLNPNVQYGFDGTFSDTDIRYSTLEGKLVFKDGTIYNYGIVFDDVKSLMKTIVSTFMENEK